MSSPGPGDLSPGTSDPSVRHAASTGVYKHQLFLFLLDESLLLAVCLLTLAVAADRSLTALIQTNDAGKKDSKPKDSSNGGGPVATYELDANMFLIIPIMFSLSLLAMFYFFAQIEFFLSIYITVVCLGALVFTLQPLCYRISNSLCAMGNSSVHLILAGEVQVPTLLAFAVAVPIVIAWLLTAHWLLLDTLAVGLVVFLLCTIKLPSLRVATYIFIGLLMYDIFWVFFSERFFHKNVMVDVAMKEARNPVGIVANKFGLTRVAKAAPSISLPGKFILHGVFSGEMSFLGLGDVFIPGLVACYAKAFDFYHCQKGGRAPMARVRRVSYFTCSLLGFCAGFFASLMAVIVYRVAQPALLYMVPGSLVPLLLLALYNGEAGALWSGKRAVLQSTPLLPV